MATCLPELGKAMSLIAVQNSVVAKWNSVISYTRNPYMSAHAFYSYTYNKRR